MSARAIARAAGVSDRTIRRWSSGEDWCDLEVIERLIAKLWPLNKAIAHHDAVRGGM